MNEQKMKEVIQNIHKAMLRKAKRGSGSHATEEIAMENRLLAVLCREPDLEPRKCAIALNERYGYSLTGDEIIQIFRNKHMANRTERKELFQWANEVSTLFSKAISGRLDGFEEYENKRKTAALLNGRKHEAQDRVAVIMLYEKYPEIDLFGDTDRLHTLGNTLAKYFFYDISDVIRDVYGFPQSRKKEKDSPFIRKMTYEEAIRKIEHLEIILDRTNTMLHDLQNEFAEELEASKVKELTDFFAKLNSERYGCILDELMVLKKGADALKKQNYELPLEINGLMIMVKKLIQFVKDSHIEPIMKINSIREVIAEDIEFCNYEGTPFVDAAEKKTVRVISPGWIYKDKEVQIARPKVKEEVR